MTEPRLATLLIPAVGGQGGGVLSEWIVEAAGIAGLVAHGTSIPGVAQRTGSTTYYVEVSVGNDITPAFSLYPIPGGLDVLLASELLEVGRMIELGFPSPARTTIIASTHRLYSIHEKITTAGSVYPSDRLLGAARMFSRDLLAFDALALAREHDTEANAILLGALAGRGAFPIAPDAYRAAIEKKAIRAKSNLRGFELGLAQARTVEPLIEDGRSSPVRIHPGPGERLGGGGAISGLPTSMPGPPVKWSSRCPNRCEASRRKRSRASSTTRTVRTRSVTCRGSGRFSPAMPRSPCSSRVISRCG